MLRSHKPTRIGDILIERGIISRPQLLQALDFQQARQLMAAGDAKRDSGNELGEILIELGFITREQLKQNLARQSRLRKTTLVVSFVAPLFTMACGGGGGGASTPPAANKPTQSTTSSVMVESSSSVPASSAPPESSESSNSLSSSSKAQSSARSLAPVQSSAQSSVQTSAPSPIASSVSSSVQQSSSSVSSAEVNGPVVLYWTAPTRRLNGEQLDITELGGYEVRYKSRDDSKFEYVKIPDAFIDTYYFDHLEGEYEFEIAAYDVDGLYSNFVPIRPTN